MDSRSFGLKVRNRRMEEGWSQEDLAKKAGISRPYLSRIERGVAKNLSLQVAEKLVTVLGLTLPAAFEGKSSWKALPPGLGEFAQEAGLPEADVDMLANIRYRGKQPSTPEEWRLLYNTIKTLTKET